MLDLRRRPEALLDAAASPRVGPVADHATRSAPDVGLTGAPFYVRRPWLWKLFAVGFGGYLISAGITEAASDDSVGRRVLALALLVAYGTWYLLQALLPERTGPWGVAALGVLGVAVVAVLGPDSIGLLMFLLVVAAMALPRNPAMILIAVTCVGMLAYTGFRGDGPHYSEVSVYASISLLLVVLGSLRAAWSALRAANTEVARLAVADERARLARDLHDVLGHSLTTVTVKAALARRLMEAGDTASAMVEITDVERLSRQTLTDMRATVSGQRETSLPAEIASARAVLEAAGITARLPQATDGVRTELREPFAYVLREAVTNVVRHSGARTCEVVLGPDWLQVRDDGDGPTGQCTPGTGLGGLRERLEPVGATVEAGPDPAGGFRLIAAGTGAVPT